jgi:hypothetical protein
VESFVADDLAASPGWDFSEQLGEKTIRASRIFLEARQSFDRPFGGTVERFVVTGREPGIQQPKRLPGGNLVGTIPAFGAEGEMVIGSSSVA